MTWALVQWSPARLLPAGAVDADELDPPPDLELTPAVDEHGRPGVWRFLGGPDVTVGFPDELSACRYVREHGIGDGTTTREVAGLLDGDGRVLVTDDVSTWAERATFVYDVCGESA